MRRQNHHESRGTKGKAGWSRPGRSTPGSQGAAPAGETRPAEAAGEPRKQEPIADAVLRVGARLSIERRGGAGRSGPCVEDLRTASRLLGQLKAMPQVRDEAVAEARRKIVANAYDTDACWDAVAEGLLRDLSE